MELSCSAKLIMRINFNCFALKRYQYYMDQAARRANPSDMDDFVELIHFPEKINPVFIRDLYLQKRLSARQIGEIVGLAKSTVLNRLHQVGVHEEHRALDKNNYAFPQKIPFGQKIIDGKLVENREEMKVVKSIIFLRSEKKLSWKKIADHLEEKKFKPERRNLGILIL